MEYDAVIPNGWEEVFSGERVSGPCQINWPHENARWGDFFLEDHLIGYNPTYRIIRPAVKSQREW